MKTPTQMVRALGPSLTDKGVPNALRNPTLDLHDSNGSIIASNDNWKDGPNAADVRSLKLAPPKEAESALLMTLPRGAYTAIVRGNGKTPSGVALVEVYNVDQP